MPIISPLCTSTVDSIQAKIDNKTKPLGALGQLETLALQLALITKQRQVTHSATQEVIAKTCDSIKITKPSMIVFAGDHGINEAGLSIAPSSVTKQMVLNFLHGGAAINCFCESNDIALTVVDCGMLEALSPDEIPVKEQGGNKVDLVDQRLGKGTENFANKPAMTKEQLEQGFAKAQLLVESQLEQGVDILLLGEMGIANTSSAAAIMSALTKYTVTECVGRGTGITDEQFATKKSLIEQALARFTIPNMPDLAELTVEEVLRLSAELGGFEIVQMAAAILTAASKNVPVVIDGFIVSAAALIALRLDKNVANYLIFAHQSEEQGHQLLLGELLAAQNFSKESAKPLLDLGLRLGEGTGGALALPLIKAAASFYNNMASFESAGVTV